MTEHLELPPLDDVVLNSGASGNASGSENVSTGKDRRRQARRRPASPGRKKARGEEREAEEEEKEREGKRSRNDSEEEEENNDDDDDDDHDEEENVRLPAGPKKRAGGAKKPKPVAPIMARSAPQSLSAAAKPTGTPGAPGGNSGAKPSEVARLSWSENEGATFGRSLILRRGQTVRIGREGGEISPDVDLSKAWRGKPLVSRSHAELRHNPANDRLELLVIGKNGAAALGSTKKYVPATEGQNR
jgi:hypothetical protein